MHGNFPRRLCRLSYHLLTHPHNIPRWFRTGLPSWNGWRNIHLQLLAIKNPLQLGIPWIPYAAIDFLKEFLNSTMHVFEWGSGGSTIFFANRVNKVISIEHDHKWHELVHNTFHERNIHNVEISHCPYDFHSRDMALFKSSTYLNSISAGDLYDVILIDGMEGYMRIRPTCFYLAEQHIKPGGIIVVDDSWRYADLRQSNKAKRVRTFKSVGPGRPGIGTADIFFY